jgi:iron complex outermembrane recepter protein
VEGSLQRSNVPLDYEEYAAFANLTVHFTDRFDVQFGGRQSENEQSFSSSLVSIIQPSNTVPETSGKDSAFTYLITPRFRVSPDLMAYARLASGYRPGGPNVFCSLAVPCKYDADTTRNYEIGMKGSLLSQVLTFDMSVYFIDWRDIQTEFFNFASVPITSFIANASRAKSQGVELAVQSKPLTGLVVSGWVAYNEAELTEDIAPIGSFGNVGHAGDRLPSSGPWSGNFSLDQDFPIGNLMGSVGASVTYVDDRTGAFRLVASQGRQILPDYTQVDVRTGLKYDTWSLNAFVNNVTNKRGVLRGGVDSFFPTFFVYIQPRTIGLSLTKSF